MDETPDIPSRDEFEGWLKLMEQFRQLATVHNTDVSIPAGECALQIGRWLMRSGGLVGGA